MAKKKKKKKVARKSMRRTTTSRKTTKRKTPKRRAKKKASKTIDVRIYKKSGRPVMIVAKGSTAKGKAVINKSASLRRAHGGLAPRFNGGLMCKPSHLEGLRNLARKMGARTKTIAV